MFYFLLKCLICFSGICKTIMKHIEHFIKKKKRKRKSVLADIYNKLSEVQKRWGRCKKLQRCKGLTSITLKKNILHINTGES